MNKNELQIIPTDNELIIDENTNLLTIFNRKKYNRLYIKKDISKLSLLGFDNVKELTFDHDTDHLSYIINKLSFSNNLEKLTLRSVQYVGTEYDNVLDLPNLKSIEFSSRLKNINKKYLLYLPNLKEIIFNISNNTNFLDKDWVGRRQFIQVPKSLEKITLIANGKKYDIIPQYKIDKIGNSGYFKKEGIVLNYENNYINTKIIIKNDIKNEINTLKRIHDDFIKGDCLFIPDYISNLDIDGQLNFNKINSISFNLDILSSNLNKMADLKSFIPDLNKIIIRKNNDMNLIPYITITEEEYGKFQGVYIQNNKINILLEGKILSVDKEGTKKIISEEKLVKHAKVIENKKTQKGARPYYENTLNNYTSNQLEYYSYYKKLLELLNSDDKEFNDAMNIVEDRLVKKLKINE